MAKGAEQCPGEEHADQGALLSRAASRRQLSLPLVRRPPQEDDETINLAGRYPRGAVL
jgi:hypothetical protein